MTLPQFFSIVEMRTKIVSVSGLVLGGLIAFGYGDFDWLLYVLMVLSALAIDMGTTAFNSFYDYLGGVDSKKFNKEQDKVIVHQNVAPGIALLVAVGLFVIGGVIGVVIAFLAGWQILLVGAACMAVGFLYNGGPLPISRTPLGELFAGGFLGGILICLTVFVVCGEFDGRIVFLGLPSTILVASILTVNNTCDIVGDRAAGRHTLSILIGPAASRVLIPAMGVLGYGVAIAAAVMGLLTPWSAIPLAAGAVLSVPLYRVMDKRGYSHTTKGPSMGAISRIFKLFSLSMAIALVLDILIGRAGPPMPA